MTDDTTPRFDPRFDPAFQRGFDPALAPDDAAAASPPSSPASSVPASVLREPAASAPRVRPPVAPLVVVEEEGDVVDAPAARNPFLLALAAIALLLIIGGVWLLVWTGAAFNSGDVASQGSYMTLDAIIHVAPFIALLGAATVIGLLFVFAARWRR